MNKRYMYSRWIGVAFMMLLAVSCDDDLQLPAVSEDGKIALSASIDEIKDEVSRASAVDVKTGISTAGLTAGIWFSNEIGKYPKVDEPVGPTYIPYRSTTMYEEGVPTTVYVDQETMTNPLSYPLSGAGNGNVYCIGLYPADNWTCDDPYTFAEHEITGYHDIMFAEQQQGSWQYPFQKQKYKHLLTWLKIEVRAKGHDAIIHWGKLKNISITSPQSKTKITFATTVGGKSTVEYTGDAKSITAWDTEAELSVRPTNAGSVLSAPATKYTLVISTEHGGEKSVEIELKDEETGDPVAKESDAVGKLYIINLCFTPFDEINATCSLVPWTEQEVEL